MYWVIPEKIHTPQMEGVLENLMGEGINGSKKQDGRGDYESKTTSSGLTFIPVSIASIN